MPPRRLPVPGVRALPPPRRARQRPLRSASRGGRRSRCSSVSGSATSPQRASPSSPAASASASRSPARSRRDPAVLLLDEPLSALDAHTRAGFARSCGSCSDALGLPTMLVTHDFEDAATLADRVGVLADGEILQLGHADRARRVPSDAFVASFTGATVLAGQAVETENGLTRGRARRRRLAVELRPGDGARQRRRLPVGRLRRHERPDDSRLNHVSAAVVSVAPAGNRTRVRIGPIVAEITAASAERLALGPASSRRFLQGDGRARVPTLTGSSRARRLPIAGRSCSVPSSPASPMRTSSRRSRCSSRSAARRRPERTSGSRERTCATAPSRDGTSLTVRSRRRS